MQKYRSSLQENLHPFLYKGEEWKSQISEFKKCKAEFDNLPDECKDNFAWKKSRMVGDTIAKIRNTSIGTLLIDLSEGVDVEEAVEDDLEPVAK